MRKTITKKFKNFKEAEKFRNNLYKKYNSVILTSFPFFSNSGNYVFMVEDEIKKK